MTGPTHRRRSSISGQIQRIFNVDRSDKRRNPHDNGLSDELSQLKNENEQAPGQTPVQLGQDETRPSSYTYSQNSRLPSTGTSHSTPPFQPVMAVNTMSLQTSGIQDSTPQEIGTSGAWETARKERRATKRLEAERTELEQRLQRLEEAQARQDHGIFDRSHSRLTKKQPLDSTAVRSSSTDGEGRRGRSSSVFSGIFSRSRRSSRSSSKDSESHRQSSETPPTLPLALPERFGTAVSRELATHHGTTLVPSHQLEGTARARHSLHTAPKSDDLRENWRMAEAWQRNSGAHDFDSTRGSVYKPELTGQPAPDSLARQDEPQQPSQAKLLADLDRDLFTATLRHDGKSVGTRPFSASSPYAHTSSRPIDLSTRGWGQSKNYLEVPDTMSTRVTTARQLHDLTPSGHIQRSFKTFGSSISMPAITKNKHRKKNGMPAGSQTTPSSFKSSPLSSNSFTSNGPEQEGKSGIAGGSISQNPDPSIIPLPLRIQVSQQHEPRGRKSASEPTSAKAQSHPKDSLRQSFQGPVSSFVNGRQQESRRSGQSTTVSGTMPAEVPKETKQSRNDRPPLPIKHADRTGSLSNNSPPRANTESQKGSGVTADAPANFSEPSALDQSNTENAPSIKSVLRCRNPSPSRTPSQSSSQASYDTADEEVLDVTKALVKNDKAMAQHDETPKNEVPIVQELLSSDIILQNEATQADSSAVVREVSERRMKAPAEQHIAKLFVICCHCKYWHDMPSEVYARLVGPERVSSETILSRTFSRQSSGGRKASLRNSLLSSNLSDSRRLLAIERKHKNKNKQSGRETQAATESPLRPPSCCWCGHNMNKNCCQGWTTLVQMGERHY
ncbi:Transport protein particle subunit bet3 [Penicillium atrosanguineum]|uniref:Transport protein particle subunit bet3 n=1 Tax=Penicillium atrosanguineum TaxID=1132637 RepID=UPI0023A414EF|nr:Transport protein particle subunit bet3 [Penicillium atrosanguineum]KAJ5300539.1 Transport protein particle subunit bet3 [Penicillium atrosanguineum]